MTLLLCLSQANLVRLEFFCLASLAILCVYKLSKEPELGSSYAPQCLGSCSLPEAPRSPDYPSWTLREIHVALSAVFPKETACCKCGLFAARPHFCLRSWTRCFSYQLSFPLKCVKWKLDPLILHHSSPKGSNPEVCTQQPGSHVAKCNGKGQLHKHARTGDC